MSKTLKLEDLKKDAQVKDIQAGEPIRIVTVERVGPDAATVYYKDSQGRLGEQMLFRGDEGHLCWFANEIQRPLVLHTRGRSADRRGQRTSAA